MTVALDRLGVAAIRRRGTGGAAPNLHAPLDPLPPRGNESP